KSGSKDAVRPSVAPSRVTALSKMIMNTTTSVGIIIRFATSIPFLTPRNKTPSTISKTIISGMNTLGTHPPICHDKLTNSKYTLFRKPSVSSHHDRLKEKTEYDIAHATITE